MSAVSAGTGNVETTKEATRIPSAIPQPICLVARSPYSEPAGAAGA